MHMSVKNRKAIMLMKIPGQPDRSQWITVTSVKPAPTATQPDTRLPTQRVLLDPVVQFAVASDLSEEQGHGGDADPGQRRQGVSDLPLNLVLGRECKYEHNEVEIHGRSTRRSPVLT